MNKKLGIKTSPQLIICRLLIFLLLNGAILSYIFAYTDLRTTEDLSEEYKEELRQTHDFRECVKAIHSIENGNDIYLKISDIYVVKYLWTQKAGSYVFFEMKGDDNDFLFKINAKEYKSIATTDYEQIKVKYGGHHETAYSGVELKYIKELAEEGECFREWQLEDLNKRKSIDVVKEIITYIQLHGKFVGYGDVRNITGISCTVASSDTALVQLYFIKVEKSDLSSPIYYRKAGPELLEATEELYNFYQSMPDKEIYEVSDIQIILEEMGIR